jgi:hypothetical protein
MRVTGKLVKQMNEVGVSRRYVNEGKSVNEEMMICIYDHHDQTTARKRCADEYMRMKKARSSDTQ